MDHSHPPSSHSLQGRKFEVVIPGQDSLSSTERCLVDSWRYYEFDPLTDDVYVRRKCCFNPVVGIWFVLLGAVLPFVWFHTRDTIHPILALWIFLGAASGLVAGMVATVFVDANCLRRRVRSTIPDFPGQESLVMHYYICASTRPSDWRWNQLTNTRDFKGEEWRGVGHVGSGKYKFDLVEV